ncbi:DNA cytosine methyltransferase [Oculatella sp. LEGE 06141]|uniref:DNA cytosine methyltransferase n=1 Tax=Oculatella sp. LEGE 06141 TaxID=1828648 RepID=UPI001880D58B|nr:DNA cytosine methyltransferase [Oculatella sp. LEGE 06141]MBE9181469.1 DNA cytosine methyltransferase [Oculatella sp. LEGE 06141]
MIAKKTIKSEKISSASFFTGIGGFDLGFERAGIESAFQCEIDEFCGSVLDWHWPNLKRFNDIRDVDSSSIPETQIWSGGFPCQDVSVARGWLGREGLKGQNSGLFYPFANLIRERLPKVVVMENVTGLLNSHNGQDFAILLHTLEKLGYGVAWRTLNTRYFGAPQSRPRVFICAWANSTSSAYHVLFEGGQSYLPEKPRLGFLRESRCDVTGARVPEIAFCLAATSGRHTGTDWSRSYVSYESEVRRLTPRECERIQGFPTNWTLPNEDYPLEGVDLDSRRYKATGNAVSVPVVQWIGERIVKELRQSSPDLFEFSLFDGIDRFGSHTPELSGKRAQKVSLPSISGHDDAPKIKWGNGGVVEKGVCLMGATTQYPLKPVSSRLIDVLDKFRPDDRYFLTSNAAEGILRRVNSQGRELFAPLATALSRLQSSA